MKDSTFFDAHGRQSKRWPKLARPILVTVEDEFEFQLAVEAYKSRSGRNFPTWSEILEVMCSLGYSKRIWRPIGVWSPISIEIPSTRIDVNESIGLVGWFSRVETPVGY